MVVRDASTVYLLKLLFAFEFEYNPSVGIVLLFLLAVSTLCPDLSFRWILSVLFAVAACAISVACLAAAGTSALLLTTLVISCNLASTKTTLRSG